MWRYVPLKNTRGTGLSATASQVSESQFVKGIGSSKMLFLQVNIPIVWNGCRFMNVIIGETTKSSNGGKVKSPAVKNKKAARRWSTSTLAQAFGKLVKMDRRHHKKVSPTEVLLWSNGISAVDRHGPSISIVEDSATETTAHQLQARIAASSFLVSEG